MGTNYNRVVSGCLETLKVFVQNQFSCATGDFSKIAGLVSPANVLFSCMFVQWHVCLEFLFDKNRFYEGVRDWNFLIFLETLWKNLIADFQHKHIHRKTSYDLVCLHIPLVSFCFTCFLQPSKNRGECWTDIFDLFSQKLSHQI